MWYVVCVSFIWHILYLANIFFFSRYAAIYGVNTQEKMQSKAFVLMNQHRNEDVRFHARKMYEAIKSWERVECADCGVSKQRPVIVVTNHWLVAVLKSNVGRS